MAGPRPWVEEPDTVSMLESLAPFQNCSQNWTQSLHRAQAGIPEAVSVDTLLALTDGGLAGKWRREICYRSITRVESGISDDLLISLRESRGPGAGNWLNPPTRQRHFFQIRHLSLRLACATTCHCSKKKYNVITPPVPVPRPPPNDADASATGLAFNLFTAKLVAKSFGAITLSDIFWQKTLSPMPQVFQHLWGSTARLTNDNRQPDISCET